MLWDWYEKRIDSGRCWPVKPEAMVLDAEKYAPRVFASGKQKLQKSIWRLTGWTLRLLNVNGRCWPTNPETKMPPERCLLLENVHLVFSRLKNSRLLFCLPAEFYSAVFGSRCDIPWKDQT